MLVISLDSTRWVFLDEYPYARVSAIKSTLCDRWTLFKEESKLKGITISFVMAISSSLSQ